MIKTLVLLVILYSKSYANVDDKVIRSISLSGNKNITLNEILFLVRQRPPNFFLEDQSLILDY